MQHFRKHGRSINNKRMRKKNRRHGGKTENVSPGDCRSRIGADKKNSVMTTMTCSFRRDSPLRHHSFFNFIIGTSPTESFSVLVGLEKYHG